MKRFREQLIGATLQYGSDQVMEDILEKIISPSGKTTKTSAARGIIEDLILWLGYYNSIVIRRTSFPGIGYAYLGIGEGKCLFKAK